MGWNWAIEAARLGHEVVVLTQIRHRAEIEAEAASGRLPPNLRFAFFMPSALERLRRRGLALGLEQLTLQLTHLVWQIAVRRHVRRHLAPAAFDLIHHITYGGIRHPTCLGRLGAPLVLGPIGGAERAPWALRRGYGWRGQLLDALRDLHTSSLRLDPITRRACADAAVIYVKTPRSRAALPKSCHHKVVVQLEIGTRGEPRPPLPPRDPSAPLKLLYAGRFVYWKGMHLGLRAFADLLERGVPAHLTMVGRGPETAAWQRLAVTLGVNRAIDWRSWIPHDQMPELYRAHDVLLFPSLHDSSGNVALEALFHGLPVACLDLGGPAEIVDGTCGRVIKTAGADQTTCIERLVDALEELAHDPEACHRLSHGAGVRARAFQWPRLVASFYKDVDRRLGRRAAGDAAAEAPLARPL